MLNPLIAEGTNDRAYRIILTIVGKPFAALDDFIVTVRLQWMGVVVKYDCQSSLVVCVKPLFSLMTLSAFFLILYVQSLFCFETGHSGHAGYGAGLLFRDSFGFNYFQTVCI